MEEGRYIYDLEVDKKSFLPYHLKIHHAYTPWMCKMNAISAYLN